MIDRYAVPPTPANHDPSAVNYRSVRARLMREYTALLAQRNFARKAYAYSGDSLARQIAAKEQELAQNAIAWAEAEDAQDQDTQDPNPQGDY